MILIDTPSTADEIPITRIEHLISADYIDSQDAPYASVKVFYRSRGGSFQTLYDLANVLPGLLMAQGVITRHDVGGGNENSEGSEVNNRKRAREDGSSGPSKRRAKSTVKREDISALSQQIQALQVSGAN